MRFLVPATINDTSLVSSSVSESEYAAWSSGTAYAIGARVIYGHKIFEALTASTAAIPDQDTAAWVLVSPTNRYAMFDAVRSTRTTAAGSISVELLLSDVTALSMIDVLGTEIVIEVTTAAAALVYSRTVTLDGVTPGSIYLADLPASAGATVTVDVTGAGTVEVGALQLGRVWVMGDTQFGLGLGITDYSKVNTDEFGNQTFIRRGFSRQMTAQVRVPRAKVDQTFAYLASIRATPVVWIGAFDYASTFVIGFYKDFNLSISYPLVSDCSLTIEGITEHDGFAFTDIPEEEGIDGAPVIGDVGVGGGATGTTGGVITAPPSVPGLLMHFDGDFADACRGRAVTTSGAGTPLDAMTTDAAAGSHALWISQIPNGYPMPISTGQYPQDFDVGAGGSLTIEYFASAKDWGSVNGVFLTFADSAGSSNYAWRLRHSSAETAAFSYRDTSGNWRDLYRAISITPGDGPSTPGPWVHVAAVITPTEIRLYVGGVLANRSDTPPPLIAPIMSMPSGVLTISSHYSVRVDDLRILPTEVYTGSTFNPPSAPLGTSA